MLTEPDLPRDWFLQLTREFIPAQWRSHTWVAGGFASDALRASDVDLWIPAGPLFARVRGDVYAMMHERGWDQFFVGDEGGSGSLHDLVYTTSAAGGFLGKPVSVLVSDLKTAQNLVDSFDISTHAIAKRQSPSGVMDVVFGKGWTPAAEPPQALRWDTPRDTLARLWKISARYGTEPRMEDVSRLANLMRKTRQAA